MSPKVLMLHGLLQNARVLEGRLRHVTEFASSKNVELVFVNAPHVVSVPTFRDSESGALAVEDGLATVDLERAPRCWWFAEDAEDQRGRYVGLEQSLAYLRRVMEEQGPFDAVWGFSQGAAMASLLTALLERPSLHSTFAAPGANWPPAPFKYSILCSGYLPLDPMVKDWFLRPLRTTSLHVFGSSDTVVPDDRFFALHDAFEKPRLEWHEAGHLIPCKASWRRFFGDYVTCGLDAEALALIAGPGTKYGRPHPFRISARL